MYHKVKITYKNTTEKYLKPSVIRVIATKGEIRMKRQTETRRIIKANILSIREQFKTHSLRDIAIALKEKYNLENSIASLKVLISLELQNIGVKTNTRDLRNYQKDKVTTDKVRDNIKTFLDTTIWSYKSLSKANKHPRTTKKNTRYNMISLVMRHDNKIYVTTPIITKSNQMSENEFVTIFQKILDYIGLRNTTISTDKEIKKFLRACNLTKAYNIRIVSADKLSEYKHGIMGKREISVGIVKNARYYYFSQLDDKGNRIANTTIAEKLKLCKNVYDAYNTIVNYLYNTPNLIPIPISTVIPTLEHEISPITQIKG